jgi:hypothetical protein
MKFLDGGSGFKDGSCSLMTKNGRDLSAPDPVRIGNVTVAYRTCLDLDSDLTCSWWSQLNFLNAPRFPKFSANRGFHGFPFSGEGFET